MPRTHRVKWGRSYAYKRNKEQRGWQKLFDNESHNSHKNTNFYANEITYTKFNCKTKFGRDGCVSYPAEKRYQIYNPADLKYYMEDYDWKKETIVEYLERKVA